VSVVQWLWFLAAPEGLWRHSGQPHTTSWIPSFTFDSCRPKNLIRAAIEAGVAGQARHFVDSACVVHILEVYALGWGSTKNGRFVSAITVFVVVATTMSSRFYVSVLYTEEIGLSLTCCSLETRAQSLIVKIMMPQLFRSRNH